MDPKRFYLNVATGVVTWRWFEDHAPHGQWTVISRDEYEMRKALQ